MGTPELGGPRARYQRRIAEGSLKRDPAQEPAVDELERLYRELLAASEEARSFSGRIRQLIGRTRTLVKGVYLYGDVGRGKTLLMDLFFHCLPINEKRRMHFHRFMASAHRELRSLQDCENPLEIVADRLARRCRVICFDEFFVSDIADAMILGNLFRALFDRGVTLAATSNTEPRHLYRDGLQRAQFLPAIAAIEANTVVLRLDGRHDYRLDFLEQTNVFITPADANSRTRLEEAFKAIAPDEGDEYLQLDVLGRPIDTLRMSDGVAWFEFSAICDGPRSSDDYIELAREFQTVLISGVPQFSVELENQARRFIALVDEFYDRKVKLIVSADVDVDALYAGQHLQHEFERTRSRLYEMQSRAYLSEAHRP